MLFQVIGFNIPCLTVFIFRAQSSTMSNTGQIIAERSRDIGDFLVGRILPFRKKRMVGPFIFIDHMGPSEIGPGKYMDIGQHPHVGLSTLTYLFEGEMVHKDSIGSEQRIVPGSVNWMTAGRGVVHTERTPADHRDGKRRPVHGFQIWVALPKILEDMEPEFHHVEAKDLLIWREGALDFTLIAGQAFGKKSPVPVHSPLFMVQIKALSDSSFDLKGAANGEVGVCVVKGQVRACEETVGAGNMLVSKMEDTCKIHLEKGTHVLLFGGEPFPEERFINWNFVATSKDRLESARNRWSKGEFKLIAGEGPVIPLPQ